ncbi:zf-HC2 domain-containing protein [Catenuloplanes atrovinosus]|uniref:Putative zinc-finger domain-containing protein n=1 Tax=Catenuloplanes atrovinosus TaxID=137266 RepID=A0AAE3YLY4_9ACTN|nr:zf-HC2 domain-containing protein [Catenuloplanes atrovinosus]MDR7274281.1 hypothetical protein [Catenuloplanes atrovinosus]
MTDDRCVDDDARSLLGLHVLGRLTEAEDEYVRFHLDDCGSCGVELAGLRQVTAALDLLSPADVAELLVADPAEDASDAPLPELREFCRFVIYRSARRYGRSPARRGGAGGRPATQLPPGRPRKR